MLTLQERLASEVAAAEKRRHAGSGKSVRGPAVVTTTHTQTAYDRLPLNYSSALVTISGHHSELEASQMQVRNKTQALESAQTLCSELQAAHDSLLQRTLEFDGIQAENVSLVEQLRQAHLDAKERKQDYDGIYDCVKRYTHETLDLTAQLSKLRTEHAQLKAKAESLQASEAQLSSALESMAQHAETAQEVQSNLEAANLAAAEQLNQLQAHCLQLEQTHQHLQALIQGTGEAAVVPAAGISPASAQSLVMTVRVLLSSLQHRAEAAEADNEKLTWQLQDAQALKAEQLR